MRLFSLKVSEVRRLQQVFHLLSSVSPSADDLGPLDPSDCSWLHRLPQWVFCLLLTTLLCMLDFDPPRPPTFFKIIFFKTKTNTANPKVPDYILGNQCIISHSHTFYISRKQRDQTSVKRNVLASC